MSPITPCTSNTVRPCKIKVIKSSEHLHTYHREVSTSKLMFKTYLVHLFLSHLCFAILSVHELRHVNQSYWIIPYIEQPHKIVMLKKCVKCWKKSNIIELKCEAFFKKEISFKHPKLMPGPHGLPKYSKLHNNLSTRKPNKQQTFSLRGRSSLVP